MQWEVEEKMPLYRINIEEMIVDTFEVEADSEDEAMEIAVDNYNSGIFVLEPGNLVAKQMSIETDEYTTEWFEF